MAAASLFMVLSEGFAFPFSILLMSDQLIPVRAASSC